MEYRFTFGGDVWAHKVFLTLLRRYDLRPYRYAGPRRTTVMAKVSRQFVDEVLWPEYEQIVAELRGYLAEVTDRIVARVLHADSSAADVVTEEAAADVQHLSPPPSSPPAPPQPQTESPAAPPRQSGATAKTSHRSARKAKKKRRRR